MILGVGASLLLYGALVCAILGDWGSTAGCLAAVYGCIVLALVDRDQPADDAEHLESVYDLADAA